MAEWISALGDEVKVGIEGAGSFGAGLCEPCRRERRHGKSDRIDALMTAKKMISGEGLSTRRASGTRAAMQALLGAYRFLMAERTRRCRKPDHARRVH